MSRYAAPWDAATRRNGELVSLAVVVTIGALNAWTAVADGPGVAFSMAALFGPRSSSRAR